MRVYVGLTRSELAAARAEGVTGTAYAVTPDLRESYAAGDQEELEYVALLAAAESCLPKLALLPDEPRRRFVVAVEVADGLVRRDEQAGPAGVLLQGPVPWSAAQAVHADDPAATGAVAAAANAYAAAQAGDDDARFTVDEVEGWELMWFATQEVDDLLA